MTVADAPAPDVLAMVPYRFHLARRADGNCVLDIFVDSGLVGWDVAFAVTPTQAAALAADAARPLLLRDAVHPHLADRRAVPVDLFPPDRFAILCDVAAFDPLDRVGPRLAEALSLFLSHQSGSLRDADWWPI